MALAMFVRRAACTRNAIAAFVRICSSSSSFLVVSPHKATVRAPDLDLTLPGFLRDSRRGFAKGKKLKDDSGSVEDIGPTVKAQATCQMEAAIDALSRDLTKLRTGRAAPGMLDHIVVETGGLHKAPLNHLALVSVLDPKTLSINPYDPDTVKELEKAIVSSPLGLNPKLDGQRLIASIPPLTKEHVQALCKIVTKSSEVVKQSIRRARQKALNTIKKAASGLPRDEVKRLEKEVEEFTKKFVKSADDMCKSKENEITTQA
ncbi:Ribosome recycling factor domain-containing protein [Hirschfeldia incana]|nr:Ribosome recycling factor domain-containing protein [Hirschfeldia incana]